MAGDEAPGQPNSRFVDGVGAVTLRCQEICDGRRPHRDGHADKLGNAAAGLIRHPYVAGRVDGENGWTVQPAPLVPGGAGDWGARGVELADAVAVFAGAGVRHPNISCAVNCAALWGIQSTAGIAV